MVFLSSVNFPELVEGSVVTKATHDRRWQSRDKVAEGGSLREGPASASVTCTRVGTSHSRKHPFSV